MKQSRNALQQTLQQQQQLQNEEPKRHKEKGFLQATCRLALPPYLKNLTHLFETYTCGIRSHPGLLEQGSSIPFPAGIKAHSQTWLHVSRCCVFLPAGAINDTLNPKVLHSQLSSCPTCVLWVCSHIFPPATLPAEQITHFTSFLLCSTAFHSPYFCLWSHSSEYS